ncbi:MAG: MgtC/SapB family protein [Ktedonobacteraceae bacterium]|nr:MgtC/SapB family protein [Ktedonobacteraceae bacterium]
MLSFPVILLRLSLALILGAIIGFERESRRHEAGIRTNALIALGCALFTVISATGFSDMLGLPHVQLDPTRIASYIIAGIGFLGGGAIFVYQEERIRGLTTAAAIWVVAAIGMACGAGLLWVAVLVTVFALIILVGLHIVELRLLPKHSPDLQTICVKVSDPHKQLISQIYDACIRNNLSVKKIETRMEQGVEIVNITCLVDNVENIVSTLDVLRGFPGVQAVNTTLQDIKREYVFVKEFEEA